MEASIIEAYYVNNIKHNLKSMLNIIRFFFVFRIIDDWDFQLKLSEKVWHSHEKICRKVLPTYNVKFQCFNYNFLCLHVEISCGLQKHLKFFCYLIVFNFISKGRKCGSTLCFSSGIKQRWKYILIIRHFSTTFLPPFLLLLFF